MLWTLPLVILSWIGSASGTPPVASPAAPASPRVTLGKPETVLASGAHGLRYFPDGPLAVVRTRPDCRVVLSAGISSFLLEGPSMEGIRSAKRVLAPGKPGEFDNGYAGIRGVWRTPAGELVALYHAEDQEGMKTIPGGIPGFYCTVGIALSKDDGLSFKKLGAVLTGRLPKDTGGRADQGIGEVSLMAEPTGRFLYAYYTSHERVEVRGVDICLARCPAAEATQPGAWHKFFQNGFTEPGIGGRETPVLASGRPDESAMLPQVVYVPAWRRFAMVFCTSAWRDKDNPQRSGIYLAFSDDGVHWPAEARQQLWKTWTIPVIGKELSWNPMLWLDETSPAQLKGWLYYAHSESWGHRAPQTPHYLVRRSISITLDQNTNPKLTIPP
jgi:hypothetical protein